MFSSLLFEYKRYYCLFISSFSIISLLSGCATNNTPIIKIEPQVTAQSTQQRWQQHKQLASSLKHWKIKGKIAVKAGTKGGHASVTWQQHDTVHIELKGPLGGLAGGRVIIDSDATNARLKDTQGNLLQGNSISALLEQRLGWPLPFDHLYFWVRGLPSMNTQKVQWDQMGRIKTMNDQGWQISYPSYQSIIDGDGNNISVPSSLELNALPDTLRVHDKNGTYLGDDFFVRLIIKSWQP